MTAFLDHTAKYPHYENWIKEGYNSENLICPKKPVLKTSNLLVLQIKDYLKSSGLSLIQILKIFDLKLTKVEIMQLIEKLKILDNFYMDLKMPKPKKRGYYLYGEDE